MPDLIPGYRYEVMPRSDLLPYIKAHRPAVFAEQGHLDAPYPQPNKPRSGRSVSA